MTLEPSAFSNEQWVRYNNAWINVVILVTLGGFLMLIGFAWGMQGISPAIQETQKGITIVDGGASSGFLLGVVMAQIGIVIISVAPQQIKKAQKVKRRVA